MPPEQMESPAATAAFNVDFLIICVRRADFREIPSGRFQIAMCPRRTCFTHFTQLFFLEQAKGKTDFDIRFFFDLADAFTDLIHLFIRQSLA